MGVGQKVTLDFNLLAAICSCEVFNALYTKSNQFFIQNHVIQKICHTNSMMDKRLIKNSLFLFGIGKRECLYIAAHTNFGEVFYSRIIKGNKSNVSNAAEIYEEVKKLRNTVRPHGLSISKIEIVHSHMKDEFVEFDESKRPSKVKAWPLSASDIDVLNYLSQKIKAPILMRAVTQNFISYEILA